MVWVGIGWVSRENRVDLQNRVDSDGLAGGCGMGWAWVGRECLDYESCAERELEASLTFLSALILEIIAV